MDPEVNIDMIHASLSKMSNISLATVKRRAERENWLGRETGGKGRGGKVRMYLTAMLPADVKAALKAVSVPAVMGERLPALEARKEVRLYEAQEQKAFAKTELAKAYVTRLAAAGHGNK